MIETQRELDQEGEGYGISTCQRLPELPVEGSKNRVMFIASWRRRLGAYERAPHGEAR